MIFGCIDSISFFKFNVNRFGVSFYKPLVYGFVTKSGGSADPPNFNFRYEVSLRNR